MTLVPPMGPSFDAISCRPSFGGRNEVRFSANLELVSDMSDWITIPRAERTIRDRLRESLRAALEEGTIRSRKVYEDGEVIDFEPIYWMNEGKIGDEAEIAGPYPHTIEINRDDLLKWLSRLNFGQ